MLDAPLSSTCYPPANVRKQKLISLAHVYSGLAQKNGMNGNAATFTGCVVTC